MRNLTNHLGYVVGGILRELSHDPAAIDPISIFQ